MVHKRLSGQHKLGRGVIAPHDITQGCFSFTLQSLKCGAGEMESLKTREERIDFSDNNNRTIQVKYEAGLLLWRGIEINKWTKVVLNVSFHFGTIQLCPLQA